MIAHPMPGSLAQLCARPAVRWWGAAISLGAIATALTLGAGTRPSFDAYGWLTWGHMTLHGGLNTNAAPSWKPLPYLFTLVYGLLGQAAQWRLWMITAIAISLSGLVFAGRIAFRLSGGGAAGWVASALAAVGLLCLRDELGYGYLHYALSAQTDPMIVGLLLGAIDCRLCGRERAAFGLLWLAALGRPEVWPFLGLDAAWLWRGRPGLRPVVAGALALAALLWFGIPALSSRSWFVAGDNALRSGRAPTGNRTLGALSRFVDETPWPLSVAAVGMVALAAWRRERLVLSLALAVVVWMAIEVAFALHGWPGLGRYMFEASAVVIVLGAGCVGRLLRRGMLAGADRWADGGRWAGRVLGAAVLVGVAVFAVVRGRQAAADLRSQQARTNSIVALGHVIDRLGGAAQIRSCGEAISDGLGTQTLLAYDVGVNVNRVGYKFPQPGHPDNPIVVFAPRGQGWVVRAHRQTTVVCRGLRVG